MTDFLERNFPFYTGKLSNDTQGLSKPNSQIFESNLSFLDNSGHGLLKVFLDVSDVGEPRWQIITDTFKCILSECSGKTSIGPPSFVIAPSSYDGRTIARAKEHPSESASVGAYLWMWLEMWRNTSVFFGAGNQSPHTFETSVKNRDSLFLFLEG